MPRFTFVRRDSHLTSKACTHNNATILEFDAAVRNDVAVGHGCLCLRCLFCDSLPNLSNELRRERPSMHVLAELLSRQPRFIRGGHG